MMTEKGQILIIDSTGNRREYLCKLWSGVLHYDVLFSGGGEFLRFLNDGEPKTLSEDELSTIQPLACIFHAGDFDMYKTEEVKQIVDSSKRVVLFSGVGLTTSNPVWPKKWFWITRAISGKGSASEREWRELGDWFTAKPSDPAEAETPVLLSVKKDPHFLIALLILCQGFLASERMTTRFPSAVAQTRKREWWGVPLFKSAGEDLESIVSAEWGRSIPDSVKTLVEWITGNVELDNSTLSDIVEEAKKELECRVAK
jgi:hypothetical protein